MRMQGDHSMGAMQDAPLIVSPCKAPLDYVSTKGKLEALCWFCPSEASKQMSSVGASSDSTSSSTYAELYYTFCSSMDAAPLCFSFSHPHPCTWPCQAPGARRTWSRCRPLLEACPLQSGQRAMGLAHRVLAQRWTCHQILIPKMVMKRRWPCLAR